MSLWIKICGNTSLADAQLAASAGADAVGFVFAPSPRRVTPAEVAAIVPHLPASLSKIGVFVDASLEQISSTVNACPLTGVQLHWNAPPDLPANLRARFGPRLRIFRVVHFDANRPETGSASGNDLTNSEESQTKRGFVSGHDFNRAEADAIRSGALAPDLLNNPNIDAILVDSRTAEASGGTGQAYDWSLAAVTIFQVPGKKKIAAGGLNPENVAKAISALRPWGVDVVSGVESAPGRKDPAKVRAFIANARAVGD